MMKLTREKIRKIIMEALTEASQDAGGKTAETEEEQIEQVKDLLGAIQKAPQFETKYERINSQPKFEALFNKLVDWSKDGPMKGKEKLIKAALLKIANSIK